MEIQILDWLQKLHTPVLDKIMCLITRLGDAGILWILLAAVLLLIPKTRKSGLILAGALVVDALLCNLILKPLVARIRPYDVNTAVQLLVSKPVDYSFPSGTHRRFFCVGRCAFYGRGEEALETGTGIGCADCFFKTVSVCTLSDGRAGWTDPGTHCRIFGKPAGSLAHGKKRELPGGCLTGGNEYA